MSLAKCFSKRLQCLDFFQIKGAWSKYNVLILDYTNKQITVKFKVFGNKKLSFFGYFLSCFTVWIIFWKFYYYLLFLMSALLLCAIGTLIAKKLSTNIEGGVCPPPQKKNLIFLPKGQKLQCIFLYQWRFFNIFNCTIRLQ